MNYIISMLLLDGYISIHNHILSFASFYAWSTPEMANKDRHTTTNFTRFLNHFRFNLALYVRNIFILGTFGKVSIGFLTVSVRFSPLFRHGSKAGVKSIGP